MSNVNVTSMSEALVQLLPDDLFAGLDEDWPSVMSLLATAESCIKKKSDVSLDRALEKLQAVLDLTKEELNMGHWSTVPESQRKLYSVTSFLKVIAILQKAKDCKTVDETEKQLESALKAVDMGLLLGASFHKQLTHAANLLSSALYKGEELDVDMPSLTGTSVKLCKVATDPVPELHRPALETFSIQHFYPRIPVKLTGCIEHWPALTRWKHVNYLLRVAGARTVPIELGSSYAENNWSQQLMTVQQFIHQYVLIKDRQNTGYLAQHQLFTQVPELLEDIREPEYCCFTDDEDAESEGSDINAWFGPAGTVSPLHFDPKHNLLAQVVGRKTVILYSPKYSDNLYPHEGRLLNNTARVDPENPDYKHFPKYYNTPAFECNLSPGDMLYIPPRWWHHVRALDISFSVSFWWS